MTKRRRLGQHYLVSRKVASEIAEEAAIQRSDRVLEIGTGEGVLTEELCRRSDRVEAYEIDEKNYLLTRERLDKHHLAATLRLGDAFESRPLFDVLVSSLPYSRSSDFVEWLSGMEYRRAVVVLQEDFVRKLLAAPGTMSYRAVSVISQASSDMEVVKKVERSSFDPPPRVNSVVVAITPKEKVTRQSILLIKRLFALKKRKLGVALKKLGVSSRGVSDEDLREKVYFMGADRVYRLVLSSDDNWGHAG